MVGHRMVVRRAQACACGDRGQPRCGRCLHGTVAGAQKTIGTHTATATKLSDERYCLPADATTSFVIKRADVTIPSKVIVGPGAPEVASGNLGEVAQLLVSDEERGLVAGGAEALVWVQVDRMTEADLSSEERTAIANRLRSVGATART